PPRARGPLRAERPRAGHARAGRRRDRGHPRAGAPDRDARAARARVEEPGPARVPARPGLDDWFHALWVLGGCEPSSARTQGAFIPGRMGATEKLSRADALDRGARRLRLRRRRGAAPPTTRTPTNSLTSRRAEAWNQSSRPSP